jgi:hypothetical protein
MVRRDVAGAKVARATAWLDDAIVKFGEDAATLVEDRDRRDLALFYLFLAVQECIDLAAHWVVDAGWMPADDSGSTFDELASRGVIAPSVATTLPRPSGCATGSPTATRSSTIGGFARKRWLAPEASAPFSLPSPQRPASDGLSYWPTIANELK